MPEGKRILVADGVTKSFGRLQALSGVGITLNEGEVHAVVGENGAGKSTLMRIISGHYPADEGSMYLRDAPVDLLRSSAGQRAGVGFVEQEGGLVPELSGAENLILAEQGAFWCKRSDAARRLGELARQFCATVDPHTPVNGLTMGQRQRLEILITLTRGAEILILDEPTAALSTDDAKTLGQIIKTFTSTKGGVFYITHKLNEVEAIADSVTVMRRGSVVGSHRTREISVTQLASEMVGISTDGRRNPAGANGDADDLIDVALGVRADARYAGTPTEACGLRGVEADSPYKSEADLRGINLTVRAGEIVGIAGVVGSGQTVLAELLAGVIAPRSGAVERAAGAVAYVPENRHRDAVALPLSIRDNMMVHMYRREAFSSGIWLRRSALDKHIGQTLERAQVRCQSIDTGVGTLSGGNQQKLVLGRELDQGPVLLVAHNPFRGLDVRAIQDVREAMNDACRAGCAVVMVSSDLDEILQVAHRVVVMFAGRIVGEVDLETGDRDLIGKYMGGLSGGQQH